MRKFDISLPVIHDFAERLYKNRRMPGCNLPVNEDVVKFCDWLLSLMFPHFASKMFITLDEVKAELTLLKVHLKKTLEPVFAEEKCGPEPIVESFFDRLPEVHHKLLSDAHAIYEGDPAAGSVDEVFLSYPGFLSIAIYRIAHEFHIMDVNLFPRMLTEYAHKQTGIDIHPGAEIGNSFFIDHGSGVVIGETSKIGDRVKIYQGVTLGALSVDKSLQQVKRHPTIEDEVVIYSGASILGGKTVIGKGAIIGGNAWVTKSVQPYSVVYNKSEVRVRSSENTNGSANFVI